MPSPELGDPQPISGSQLAVTPSLARLPEEIVEYITECMRYPIYPQFEATEAFLSGGRTGFSAVRFSLSSFSKVCKAIRMTVERLLYRDIHLDIIAWSAWTRPGHSYDAQKHPIWPAACLRLLLRTLEKRPDLGRFVRSVALRWTDWPILISMIKEQLEFLRLCPGLQSLSFSSMPGTLLEALETLNLQITSFAAVSLAANVPRIIQIFPNLINLHLHIHGNPASSLVPDHKISGLHFKLVRDQSGEAPPLKFALAVARDVRTFYLESLAVVAFPLPTPSMQASVEHLRLKSVNPFALRRNDDGVYLPLAAMTALRHLHVMRPSPLSVHAFSSLPPNLRSITFSDYALDSTKTSAESKSCFVQSVVDCLNTNSKIVKLAGIKTYGAVPGDPWELGDLKPVQSLCRERRVPFIQIGAYADIEPELMIFFK